jgi:hypothetical protein
MPADTDDTPGTERPDRGHRVALRDGGKTEACRPAAYPAEGRP